MGTATRLPGAKSITEELIVQMLTETHLNHTQMAEKFNNGVHRETIRRIRHGLMYAEVRPDIPRWERPRRSFAATTCWNCVHVMPYYEKKKDGTPSTRLTVACGIGLPDPLVHGAKFARECAIFTHKEDCNG